MDEQKAMESFIDTLERASKMPSDLRQHPKYVDWGEDPDAVVCAECGEKGLERAGVIVHGGIPFERDPYEWYFGKRDRSQWEGTLEIRIQHDKVEAALRRYDPVHRGSCIAIDAFEEATRDE